MLSRSAQLVNFPSPRYTVITIVIILSSVIDSFNLIINYLFIFLGIQEFPENIKNCKVLTVVEASVNPISK